MSSADNSKSWARSVLIGLFQSNFSSITTKLLAVKAVFLHKELTRRTELLMVDAKAAVKDDAASTLAAICCRMVELFFIGRLFEVCFCGKTLNEFNSWRLMRRTKSFKNIEASNQQLTTAVENFMNMIPDSGLYQKTIQSVEQVRAGAQRFVDSALPKVLAQLDQRAFEQKQGALIDSRQALIAELQLALLTRMLSSEKEAADLFSQANNMFTLAVAIGGIFEPLILRCIFSALTYGEDEERAFENAKAELKIELEESEGDDKLLHASQIFDEQMLETLKLLVERFEEDENMTMTLLMVELEKAATQFIKAIDAKVKQAFEGEDEEVDE